MSSFADGEWSIIRENTVRRIILKLMRGLSVAVACIGLASCALAQQPETEHPKGQLTIIIPACDYKSPEDVDRDEAISVLILANCLDNPDPDIRDGIGYTVMAEMLRNHRPDDTLLEILSEDLMFRVQNADEDPNGLQRPFAMLALSEVVRTDRIEAWLPHEKRLEITKLAADYLISLDDYRGFDDEEGWRHGVAHTADVFLQLSLNDQLTSEEALIILQAIGAKVAPLDAPAYVFGEPDRLARPIIYLARTDLIDVESWAEWFDGLKPDGAAPRWQNPYMQEAGLRALHNTRGFAYSVYVNARASETDADDFLVALALGLLTTVS